MNGVDYTKQLAKERDYFQDAIQKNKQATDKRITDVEKTAADAEVKNRESFVEDKAKLEKSYQKSLGHLKDKTAAAIENTNDKSSNNLAKEREDFTKAAQVKSKDFDQRLNDIKSSYQKSIESTERNHDELAKSQKTRYDRNVGELVQKTDKSLGGYQEKMHGAGADLKDQYNRERQQLVRHQEDNLLTVYKDNAEKRAFQRENITNELKKSNEVHEADRDNQKQYVSDRLTNMQDQYASRVDDMARDYSERSDNLARTEQKNALKANKEHQGQIDGVRRDFNKQMRLVELDKRRRDNGSGEFNNVMNKQQGLKSQQILDQRMKNMREDFVTAKNKYQEMAQANQDNHNESLRKESASSTANLDKKLFAANSDKLITVAHEREKSHEQITNRERQNKIDKDTFDRQLQFEKTTANSRLNKLKQNFNTSMTILEEKHKNDITDVTITANLDKKEFQKNLNERRNNELFDMKREFSKLLDTTVFEYENRLGNYQRENETLRLEMDTKVNNIVDQMDKSLETERKLNTDKRTADLRSHQLLRDQRENGLKTQMNEMSTGYQRKMDNMQIESDLKLKLLTNEYENKLKQLASAKDKEMNTKQLGHPIELERMKVAYAEEKGRLVSQYQNQIDSAKKTHAEQIEQMKNFKNLG